MPMAGITLDEDDKHIRHNDGLFDVPQPSINDHGWRCSSLHDKPGINCMQC